MLAGNSNGFTCSHAEDSCEQTAPFSFCSESCKMLFFCLLSSQFGLCSIAYIWLICMMVFSMVVFLSDYQAFLIWSLYLQIEWSVRGGGSLQNVESARISVPSTLKFDTDMKWLLSLTYLCTLHEIFEALGCFNQIVFLSLLVRDSADLVYVSRICATCAVTCGAQL